MGSSRKRRSGSARIAVGLSGGVDSVALLHMLKERAAARGFPLQAIHINHGLSPNAHAWAAFCRRLCKRLGVPLTVRSIRVRKTGEGLEAAARNARYKAFSKLKTDCIALAHNLDDQAETVLMNLLRGAGLRGASGMAPESRLHGKRLLRPLLDVPRREIERYARRHGLEWIEDESNADESLTRNFIRRRVAPLLAQKYPRWRENLARAARHFSRRELGAEELLRAFLKSKGLRAPTESKLVEMLKQLTSGGSRTLIEHDGARLRVYRGSLVEDRPAAAFTPLQWNGERRLAIPQLGGELSFRRARGRGITASAKPLRVMLRSGGERLQPDARRPRRTLKNLFQEAGVPPWERDRLPMLFRGEELVWVPGLGIDARFQTPAGEPGVIPQWSSWRFAESRKMPG